MYRLLAEEEEICWIQCELVMSIYESYRNNQQHATVK
jgi:hypothetical protein